MNPLRDMILNEIVKPEIAAYNRTYIGEVYKLNGGLFRGANTIDVKLRIKSEDGGIIIEKIPYPSSSDILDKDLELDDSVVVGFLDGTWDHPYIISIVKKKPQITNTGKTHLKPESTQTPRPSNPSVYYNEPTVSESIYAPDTTVVEIPEIDIDQARWYEENIKNAGQQTPTINNAPGHTWGHLKNAFIKSFKNSIGNF